MQTYRMDDEHLKYHNTPMDTAIKQEETVKNLSALSSSESKYYHLSQRNYGLQEDQLIDILSNRKIGSAKAYIHDRFSRMAGENSEDLEARVESIHTNLETFRNEYESLGQTALETRLNQAHGAVKQQAPLSKSQLGKRRKKAAQKTATAIRMKYVEKDYLTRKNTELEENMAGGYEALVREEHLQRLKPRKKVNGESFFKELEESEKLHPEKFMPVVREEHPYFSEINEFYLYFKDEAKARSLAILKNYTVGSHRIPLDDAYYAKKKKVDEANAQLAQDFHALMFDSQTSDNLEQDMLQVYERNIMALDLREFDYSSIEEFTEKITSNHIYSKLRALAGAKRILDRMEASGKEYRTKDLFAFKTKLATLNDILDDYETRRQMLSSPYYILLARKDAAGLSLKELNALSEKPEVVSNPGLKDYVQKLLKLRQSPGFKMGSNANKCYKEKQKKTLKDQHDSVIRTSSAILKEAGFDSVEQAVEAANLPALDERISDLQRRNNLQESRDAAARFLGKKEAQLSLDSRQDETNAWVRKFKSIWFSNLGGQYNQYLNQYPGTFQKLVEQSRQNDPEITQRANYNDAYFDDLYLRQIMRDQQGTLDFSDNLSGLSNNPLFSRKEVADTNQMRDLIRKTQRLIDLELDRKQQEYESEKRWFEERLNNSATQ